MNSNVSSNLPKKLGKWEIKRRLASREDKIVLLGEHNGEFAAIKLLKNAILLDERERRRFDQEIINLKKLDHPAIPKVVDFDVVDASQPWIATSFISGPTLQERVAKKTLRIDEWLKALKEITDALSYIHSLGVIHRDISPSNIILSDDGAKLIDFGLSFVEESQTLTKTGLNIQGTPVTVSPESITFRRDPKMDMFSLGSTFVYAGTGAFPFQHEDHEQENWLQSVLFEAPDFHNLSSDQIQFVTPLLYKNSRDRVSSADFLKILSSAGFHDDQVRLNSPALKELLVNSEEKLRGSTRNDLNVKANGRKLLISLIGLMGVLSSIFVISRFVYIGFLEIAIVLFLGVFPILAISSGFIAFLRGIGRKKWGRRRLLASSGLAFAGILAPYLAVVIFALSSTAPYSLQSLLQDVLEGGSISQVSSETQTDVAPTATKSNQDTLESPSPQSSLESNPQNSKPSKSAGFTSNDCEELFLANSKDALSACKAASAKNDDRSTYYLAAIYDMNGQKKEAEANYLKAVSLYKDDTKSMLGLVQIYLDQNNLKDYQIWVEKCANYFIKTTSGARCKLLFGIDKINAGQTKAGIAYLSDSFDWGNLSAGTYLAKYFETQKDYSKSLSWYEKAAEGGDPLARSGLIALSYDQGKMDLWKKWITKSASEGNVADIGRLAIYLTIGEKNYDEGKKWGLIGGKSGDATSMFAAGYSFYKGDKNISEAKTWLLKSANLNNLLAARVLGEIYRSEKNSTEAIFWYKKASAGDDVSSTYQLAMINLNDVNNLTEACNYFRATLTLAEKLKKSGSFASSSDQKYLDNSLTGISTFCS